MRSKSTVLVGAAAILLAGWMVLRPLGFERLEAPGPEHASGASAGGLPEQSPWHPLREIADVEGRSTLGREQQTIAQAETENSEQAAEEGQTGELAGRLLLVDERLRLSNLRVSCTPKSRWGLGFPWVLASHRSEALVSGQSYRFVDQPVGEYHLIVTFGPGNGPLLEQLVHIGPGTNKVDLFVGDLDPASSVLLRCLDPKGQPVEATGFDIVVGSSDGKTIRKPVRHFPTRNGEQAVDLEGDGTWPKGAVEGETPLTLIASHGEHGDTKMTLDPGQKDAVLQFEEACRLELQFTGVPVELRTHYMVVLRSATLPERPAGKRQASPDWKGSCHFRRAEQGDAWIDLYLGDGDQRSSGDRKWIHRFPVTLSSGTQMLKLPFPPLFEILIHNPGGWAGRAMIVENEDAPELTRGASSYRLTMDLDLRGQLENCPAGAYLVRYGSLIRRVEVPCGEIVLQK